MTSQVLRRHRGLLQNLLDPGSEWLYCWTPDGWLAAPGRLGWPPVCWFNSTESENDPEWTAWLESTAKVQSPEALNQAINRRTEKVSKT